MKTFSRVVAIALLIVMATCSLAFAGTLELVDTYPEKDSHNAAIDNFGVKLYFNENIYGADMDMSVNEKAIVMHDEDGKEVPTIVMYSPKEKNMILVLAKQNTKGEKGEQVKIAQDMKYTVKISKDLQAANGDKLKKAEAVSFKTMNQSRSTMISMAMMGIMFAGIFIVSSRNMKKDLKKKIQEETVNPYKVARETGKTVEEVVAADQKAKQKKAEKEAWRAFSAEEDDDASSDSKHVKGPRPISAGGSTYITGRKALAKKQAEEARAQKSAKKSAKRTSKRKR